MDLNRIVAIEGEPKREEEEEEKDAKKEASDTKELSIEEPRARVATIEGLYESTVNPEVET